MVLNLFIDPYRKSDLKKGDDGNLYYQDRDTIHIYKNYDGIYDFVSEKSELLKEREHYDLEYSAKKPYELTQALIKEAWFLDIYPWRKTLLDSLGKVRDKKILLVGNGESCKELYFLTLGAKLVFTDLSLEAVQHMRKCFRATSLNEAYCNKIEFHAVDALNLPFQNEEFDIIYGSAFVHHLEDLDSFFSEVYRCLNKNGICRFIDEADSPLWRLLKGTLLYPFKKYSHQKQPRSPADIRAEHQEGYTFERMVKLKDNFGFRDLLFCRQWFLLRIVSRHYSKYFNYDPKAIQRAHKLFLVMKWLDSKLSNTKLMQKNQLILIWGFNK